MSAQGSRSQGQWRFVAARAGRFRGGPGSGRFVPHRPRSARHCGPSRRARSRRRVLLRSAPGRSWQPASYRAHATARPAPAAPPREPRPTDARNRASRGTPQASDTQRRRTRTPLALRAVQPSQRPPARRACHRSRRPRYDAWASVPGCGPDRAARSTGRTSTICPRCQRRAPWRELKVSGAGLVGPRLTAGGRERTVREGFRHLGRYMGIALSRRRVACAVGR